MSMSNMTREILARSSASEAKKKLLCEELYRLGTRQEKLLDEMDEGRTPENNIHRMDELRDIAVQIRVYSQEYK